MCFVSVRTRGIPTRGRGLRGSYSRGGHTDRMSHSAHHDSSYPRYQIQKRPTPLERDESTEVGLLLLKVSSTLDSISMPYIIANDC